MQISTGQPYPLGAVWDGAGVNFALFSGHATAVELCLFDSPQAKRESVRVRLPQRTDFVWHGYVAGLGPGQLYGYRVHGPYTSARGAFFNPSKVLLDPYAKAVGRVLSWRGELYAYRVAGAREEMPADHRDSAMCAPLGMVIDPAFDWDDDRPPRTPWTETVLYELHVRGFTKRHPDVPQPLRGTYAGLASEAALEHLKRLGVTAVQLMPVHHHVDDRRLIEAGLTNYWGYNTLAFFAPERSYAADCSPQGAVREFKTMVRALHRAGIEVVLDVVYNHTAEQGPLGPALSFRGIDNELYYRLDPEDKSKYVDYTGVGNTLNVRHPRVLQLVTDSLRYWVQEMHADGFRFDLAVSLGREEKNFDAWSGFFDAIAQDPVLSRVKLIAEPWDLGPGGYQVGGFPVGWSELNGRFRDDVRRYWRGDQAMLPPLATRLAGSSDLYGSTGRGPRASINFITSHDGFTLQDLVTYSEKHNLANGEDNRDGDNHNNSSNYGVEGPTEDPRIRAVRQRQVRNFLATLFLSRGVPFLLAGDETGRTQQGNNNAYCQDNEISWLDWRPAPERESLLAYVRKLIELRKQQPVLRRGEFFHGRLAGDGFKDLTWYDAFGREMTMEAWGDAGRKSLGALLVPEAEAGGDPLFLMTNAAARDVRFRLPKLRRGAGWDVLLDTSCSHAPGEQPRRGYYSLAARSLVLLRMVKRGRLAALRRAEGETEAGGPSPPE